MILIIRVRLSDRTIGKSPPCHRRECYEPDNDYYESMRGNISVEPDGIHVGSFCEFQNLREQAARIQEQRLKGK